MWRVDSVYYFCLARLRLSTLAHQRGECSQQSVDALGTHLVVQMRKLHDSGLLVLLHLPQA